MFFFQVCSWQWHCQLIFIRYVVSILSLSFWLNDLYDYPMAWINVAPKIAKKKENLPLFINDEYLLMILWIVIQRKIWQMNTLRIFINQGCVCDFESKNNQKKKNSFSTKLFGFGRFYAINIFSVKCQKRQKSKN